eukprot:Hpha_TRINITY_DN3177_c0_g1::TRINITY_DN3177_c0_g1_i1::g.96636::m.96636
MAEEGKGAQKWARFIKGGYLVMVIVRKGKHSEPERVDPKDFLSSEDVVRSKQMETVYFHYNTTWKVNLDFKKPLPCVRESWNAVREATDWVLCHTDGKRARFDLTDQRLYLENCTVCIASTVEALIEPFNLALVRKGDESDVWVVQEVWR